MYKEFFDSPPQAIRVSICNKKADTLTGKHNLRIGAQEGLMIRQIK